MEHEDTAFLELLYFSSPLNYIFKNGHNQGFGKKQSTCRQCLSSIHLRAFLTVMVTITALNCLSR